MIRAFIRQYSFLFWFYLLLLGSQLLLFSLYHFSFYFLIQVSLFSTVLFCILLGFLFWKFSQQMKTIASLFHHYEHKLLQSPIDLAYLKQFSQEDQQHQQDMLAVQSREKELQAFIQMWSHQMKVPLATLSLMVQTQKLEVREVENQLLRLEHYLANLLNYLKLSNQVSDFRFQEVSVRDVMVDLIKRYRTQFLHKQISVDIEGDWFLKSDAKWLTFALAQILDNALKYSPNQSQITIQLDQGIVIKDQGIGILAEDLPRLFEQGFTGFNGRKHQKASGLGLYLAKRSLDQLNLEIRVESQVNQGTSVRIEASP